MDIVRWETEPSVEGAVLIAAFEGWNDAGDAATTAVQYLARAWEAEQFADMDPEDFYDFTAQRPQVRLVDGMTRSIQWPENNFWLARTPGESIVLLDGTEPHLHWRSFCDAVIDVARRLNVRMVVTLGALIADVPHTKPVPITGSAADAELAARLNLSRSRYEGPTGIVGVLHDACSQAGIESASLWAAVPHYVSHNPSPRAALALIERVLMMLDLVVDTADLEIAAVDYDRQVEEVVESDPEAAAYVRTLEESSDDDDDVEPVEENLDDFSREKLVAEAEKFLRTHGDEAPPGPTPPE